MQHWELDRVVGELRAVREQWRASNHAYGYEKRELPSGEVLREVMQSLRSALFPMRLGPSHLRNENEDFYVGHTLDIALDRLLEQVKLECSYRSKRESFSSASTLDEEARGLVHQLALSLPGIRQLLDTDILAAYHGDPAARTVDEVLLCYPGVQAVIYYRIAHQLYLLGLPLLARMITELAHSQTGIDIHPGAQIGRGFFIDHGTGVVIGETAIIGEYVRLYQAVTLGAKRFVANEEGELLKGLSRHPIVEDRVVIYAGATILGRVTIGHDSIIGGNVWLTRNVPPESHITQATSKKSEELEGESGVF
jgi:serine O-acetyltransferase